MKAKTKRNVVVLALAATVLVALVARAQTCVTFKNTALDYYTICEYDSGPPPSCTCTGWDVWSPSLDTWIGGGTQCKTSTLPPNNYWDVTVITTHDLLYQFSGNQCPPCCSCALQSISPQDDTWCENPQYDPNCIGS